MANKKILCVDDDITCRMIYQAYLSEEGDETIVCSSGEEAIELLHHTDVDIIILDINMEGINGLETCSTIKADFRFKDLPIIIVTAANQKEDVKRSFIAGADDFISKPIRQGELLGKIEILFSKYQMGSVPSKSQKIAAVPTEKGCDFSKGSLFNGRYTIQKLLISNCRSRLYLASDTWTSSQNSVTLKIFDHSILKSTDPKFLQRFLRETYQQSDLDHRNIVKIYDIGQCDGIYFIAMEYISGGSLEELIEETGRLPQESLSLLAHEVNAAIHYLQGRNIVHRDIKPANIMIDSEGYVKLVDFGLAREHNEHTISIQNQFFATPLTVSPEMIDNPDDANSKSDIYSLGITLYYAATGFYPHNGATLVDVIRGHLFSPPVPLSIERPELCRDFTTMVDCMIEKEQEKRPNCMTISAILEESIKS